MDITRRAFARMIGVGAIALMAFGSSIREVSASAPKYKERAEQARWIKEPDGRWYCEDLGTVVYPAFRGEWRWGWGEYIRYDDGGYCTSYVRASAAMPGSQGLLGRHRVFASCEEAMLDSERFVEDNPWTLEGLRLDGWAPRGDHRDRDDTPDDSEITSETSDRAQQRSMEELRADHEAIAVLRAMCDGAPVMAHEVAEKLGMAQDEAGCALFRLRQGHFVTHVAVREAGKVFGVKDQITGIGMEAMAEIARSPLTEMFGPRSR